MKIKDICGSKKGSKMNGWWEEYKCGCTSETVKRKVDLLGYCPQHGEDRRHIHPDVTFETKAKN